MKPISKSLVTSATLAMTLILFATMLSTAGSALAREGPFTVMMIVWRGCEDACRGFQDYLRERGITAEVIVRNADRRRDSLAEFIREAKDRKVDLVVTWGTSVTLEVAGPIDAIDPSRHITGIPIVFMIVADPVGAKIVAGYESSNRTNVTGTRNRVPEAVQMKAIKAYRPFKRLGLVYNRNELNSVLNADKIAALATRMDFELIAHEMPLKASGKPNADDIPEALRKMKEADVDFVYVGSSSFLMANRDRFTSEALKMGLPVATAYEAMATKSHALIAVASRYYSVGRLAGFQAEQILIKDIPPVTIPIRSLSRFSYVINMDSARQLSAYPPLSVLRYAEVVNGMPAVTPLTQPRERLPTTR
jgi:putative ABC transport system substrate-binding protein